MAELEIGNIVFEVEDNYNEGDTLSAAEATALNGLRRENLRNNFRKAVKDAGDEPTAEQIDELKLKFTAYAEGYEFAGKRQAKTPKDPVAAKAFQIATSVVKQALRKKNIDIDSLAEGKFDALVAQYAAREDVQAIARQQVDLTRNIADEAMDAAAE